MKDECSADRTILIISVRLQLPAQKENEANFSVEGDLGPHVNDYSSRHPETTREGILDQDIELLETDGDIASFTRTELKRCTSKYQLCRKNFSVKGEEENIRIYKNTFPELSVIAGQYLGRSEYYSKIWDL